MPASSLGIIGLGVMGRNLLLNLADHGFAVAGYDTDAARVDALRAEAPADRVAGFSDLQAFVGALERPRRIIMLVPAGDAVDAVIDALLPFLDPDDLLIDGGNSHYRDTERRAATLEARGLRFIGTGVSGGEAGARFGPAIMPGGSAEAYALMAPVFEAIAARVGDEPCVAYMGPRGAGHYVKMVHNGIEYGDMQLIAEAYDLLHRGHGLSAPELHEVFSRWNDGVLSSYLIRITADIFLQQDPETSRPLVDVILDAAGQKGTGRWTSHDALDLGVPVPTIQAAIEARALSALRAERVEAASVLPGPAPGAVPDRDVWIEAVGDALFASKVCSYAQGMALLRTAGATYGYDLNLAEIARIWRGGCIIRARFLDDIREAFAQHPDLPNLLLAPFFASAVAGRQAAWRRVVAGAATLGIPVPAMSASLAYYDGYRAARLPANLIQAQRDYFGAHTYRRIDRDGTFHTEWSR